MAAKAKLEKTNFESPIEALQRSFNCAPGLLKSLNAQKRFDVDGETLVVPNVATVSLPLAASIVVNGTDNGVSVVDSSGNVVARFPASIGSETRSFACGCVKVLGVKRDPFFHYNPSLFWDADSSDAKSKISTRTEQSGGRSMDLSFQASLWNFMGRRSLHKLATPSLTDASGSPIGMRNDWPPQLSRARRRF
jgi:hypothetical protein